MDAHPRHEWKHEINYADMLVLRQRLSAVMQPDPYAPNGRYEIRSLYFDSPSDKALREKLDGINRREKFRIRYYNHDRSFIRLEKKSKFSGLGRKDSCILTAQQAQAIVNGAYDRISDSEPPLLQELYGKMTTEGLRPRTIVDYTREPFLFPAGNVRVTLDYNIRTGLLCTDFLNPDCITIPAGDTLIILEVKWDAFLPAVIRDLIQLEGRHTSAFSKYAVCRRYG